MVCCKCKRAVLFASQIEPDYTEEDEEQLNEYIDQLYSQLEITGVDLARAIHEEKIEVKSCNYFLRTSA